MFTFTVKLVSYMDEKEEKEASYLLKLCRWHEANLAFKKLILKRYETVQLLHSCTATVPVGYVKFVRYGEVSQQLCLGIMAQYTNSKQRKLWLGL